MRSLVTILIFLMALTTLANRATLTAVGLDINKLLVTEFYYNSGKETSQYAFIYNPQNQPVSVSVMAQLKKRKNVMYVRYKLESDTILSDIQLGPHDYVLLKDFFVKLSRKYLGLIEFYVNGDNAGLYEVMNERKPRAVEKGHVYINRRTNVGAGSPVSYLYNTMQCFTNVAIEIAMKTEKSLRLSVRYFSPSNNNLPFTSKALTLKDKEQFRLKKRNGNEFYNKRYPSDSMSLSYMHWPSFTRQSLSPLRKPHTPMLKTRVVG